MNRHREYRPVNSYWVEEVPRHWKTTKNKFVFCQNKLVVGENWEDFTLLTMGKSGVKPRNMDKGGKFPESFENYQVVKPDQIIFCLFDLDETPRTVGLSKDYGMITSAYDVFSTNDENDSQYWTYFYQTIDDHKGLRPYYTGLRKVVRSDTFLGIEIYSPPLEEQKLISRYLNKKTEQINSLIEKIQQKIKLLEEQRASLINQCVTKGLNPDVEMKDSGIEWIGEIPSHWMLLPIKFLVDTPVTDGPHETPEFIDDGVPFLSVESVVENKLVISRMRGYISKELHKEYSKKCKPRRNDIFLVKSGSTTGKSAIVETDKEFNVWSPLCLIRSNTKKIRPQFFFQSLQSDYFRKSVELAWSFGTQPNIGMNVIENLKIVLPPLDEQVSIITELKPKLSIFDKLVEKENKRINLLREYRQSLISNVVTGKVRITEEMI